MNHNVKEVLIISLVFVVTILIVGLILFVINHIFLIDRKDYIEWFKMTPLFFISFWVLTLISIMVILPIINFIEGKQ